MILDFETNSINIDDAVEVAAFRIERVNNEYKARIIIKGVLIGIR